jgi:phosphoglycolate phosphatase-like HAD superfamily hydrolase
VRRGERYRVILLDLDGVLLDSRPVMEAAWRAVQDVTGIDVPFAAYFREIGRPLPDILTRLGLDRQNREVEYVYTSAAREFAWLGQPYPGINVALAKLVSDGASLGIVTSKDETRTARAVESFDVSFRCVMCPRSGYRGKPAPDLLLLAAAEIGSRSDDMIYVGDMAVDAQAAANADIDFAHAAWGYGTPPAGCRSLTSVEELALLARHREPFPCRIVSGQVPRRTM